MILYTKNKKQITIDDTPFAAGGQGSIHYVLSPVFSQPHVVKLFLTPQKALSVQQRIEYMCNHNPLQNAQQMVQEAFAWPQEALYDSTGDFVGFSMLLIKDSKPLWNLTTPKGFNDPIWSKFNINDPNSYNTRLRILYNACQALDVLDKYGQYRVIDLKPVNFMLKNNGHCVIIDNDSFQIAQGSNVLYYAEAATEEFCPPEFHQGKIDFNKDYVEPTWDYFSFAVMAYQLLFCIHPFTATHSLYQTQPELIENGLFVHGQKKSQLQAIPAPHGNFTQLLSKPLQDLFMRCFDDGHTNPKLRPDFVEWRNAFLNEIHKINNQNITAGVNQPTPRRQPRILTNNPFNAPIAHQPNPTHHPPVPAPQPLAVINGFSILPGGPNIAILTWSVANAQSVYVNGHNVGMAGTMQIPAVSGSHQIEAIDINGTKVSQTLLFNMPVSIRSFSHKICNGYIELNWDVQGAVNVDVNNQNVSASGALNMPLAVGTQILTATSATGFTLTQDTHINCVALIRDFHYNLFRTSAEIEWEVWNASSVLLNGVAVNAISKQMVSLRSNNYIIDATDTFGNTISNTQTINISAQVRRLEIIPGQYTAKVYWDLWYVQHAQLDHERISLKGDMIIPLVTKTFTLELTDFNGIVSNSNVDLTAPVNVPLMPVKQLNNPHQQLCSLQELNDAIISITKAHKLNESKIHLVDALTLKASNVQIQNSTQKTHIPVGLHNAKRLINVLVALNIPQPQKGLLHSKGNNRIIHILMQYAAFLISFFISAFIYIRKI